jgi:protein SCO1/2
MSLGSTTPGHVTALVAALLAGSLVLPAGAAGVPDPHAGHTAVAAAGSEPSDTADALPAVTRSVANYVVPAIRLVRDDGLHVQLDQELNDGRPVVLNFIYTTCSGICPLASHVFSELQRDLGAGGEGVHLVSISIDPEEDTPARLRAYARKFSAGPGWQHYSGTVAASVAAQRAFDVYRGDKMGHTPVTLMRAAPGGPWVRFDGFATADLLLKELHDPNRVAATLPATRQ